MPLQAYDGLPKTVVLYQTKGPWHMGAACYLLYAFWPIRDLHLETKVERIRHSA